MIDDEIVYKRREVKGVGPAGETFLSGCTNGCIGHSPATTTATRSIQGPQKLPGAHKSTEEDPETSTEVPGAHKSTKRLPRPSHEAG